MRDDHQRLLDILEAVAQIEKYAAAGRQRFERDELVQKWVLHHLLIIGEACRGLSAEIRQRHREVLWSKIIGMRNVLVHTYFDVDLPAVWSAVEQDLPQLKRGIEAILKALQN